MTRAIGRLSLQQHLRRARAAGESVVLCGPAGSGRSTLLDAVAHEAAGEGMVVLRCAGSPGGEGHRSPPLAAVRDLLWHACTADDPRVREALRSCGLPAADPSLGPAEAVDRLLTQVARAHPVLVVADDLHWLDAASSAVVGAVRRRLRGRVMLCGSVLAGAPLPTPEPGSGEPHVLSGLRLLDVPPLDVVDLVELLDPTGVGPDVAQRLHRESGGNPALALALAGALGERPQVLGGPRPLPDSLRRVAEARCDGLAAPVRHALTTAALLHRPTVRDLERAGHPSAATEVAVAAAAGLIEIEDDDGVRFVPSVLREVLIAGLGSDVAARHAALASTAADAATRLRHRALAGTGPDAPLATQLAAAARTTAERGARDLAAELLLLAAARASLGQAAARVEWLVSAAEIAAPGNHADLVRRALVALRDVVEPRPSPAQAVRARLVVPELAGLEVRALEEVLAAALADAGDDALLVAQVLLQRGRIALAQARPLLTRDLADRAVGLLEGQVLRIHEGMAARQAAAELPRALATLAVAQRWVGADHRPALTRGLALAEPAAAGYWHVSPQYTRARFALYDDDLPTARAQLLDLLARSEPGAGVDLMHVLRSLVEVAARAGEGAEALAFAARASRVAAAVDAEAHTTWFIEALAASVGGDVARAASLARRGAQAADERGDLRYLVRHLAVLGQCRLRSGDLEDAAACFRRIAAVEDAGRYDDPTAHRWQPDHAAVLVRLGRPEEAADLLARTRVRLARRPTASPATGAALDRAEAELLLATGRPDAAADLAEQAAKVGDDHGLHLDVVRALMVGMRAEQRRRRTAAARDLHRRAHAELIRLGAHAWLPDLGEEPGASAATVPGGAGGTPTASPWIRLTEAERQIARAVAEGATNREIAAAGYVSVKTVEATLTRIYRKVGVRSRAQLVARLGAWSDDRPAR